MDYKCIHDVQQAIMVAIINDEEFRIKSYSNEMFDVECSIELGKIESIVVSFFMLEEYEYKEIEICEYDIKLLGQTEFTMLYEVKVFNNQCYCQNANKLINLLDGTKDIFSSNFIKYLREIKEECKVKYYPKNKDDEYYDSYKLQREEWFMNIAYADDEFDADALSKVDMAFEIDNYDLYDEYLKLSKSDFIKKQLEKLKLDNHQLFKKSFERIYIGNQFCHNLFPDEIKLLELLDKANKEKLKITVAFTYIRENYIEKNRQVIQNIYAWCKKNDTSVEIVVNDWGMFELMEMKEDYLKSTFGILLNKRKKDNRCEWKWGDEKYSNNADNNNLSVDEFRDLLEKKLKICRYEYETSQSRCTILTKNNSLHFPYFQMNTSQYCPLHAQCTSFNREKQSLVTDCKKYCAEFVFMYPKHLSMIGRYNSNFGFNPIIMKDFDTLKYYINEGIDRLVFRIS